MKYVIILQCKAAAPPFQIALAIYHYCMKYHGMMYLNSKHLLHFDTPADDVVAVSACINQLLTLRNDVH